MTLPSPHGRVFGYIRISTGLQSDGQSLEVQRRQLDGWAMLRGFTIDLVHSEPGVSGAVPFTDRPEGAKLWATLARGDGLVAAKLDRMFRSAVDCLTMVELFRGRGVALYLLDLNGGMDDVTGNGIARLFLTIVSAFAEFERDRIGERIKASKQRQKDRGKYRGGTVPFGWRLDGEDLLPVPDQQAAIEMMQRLRGEGLALRVIADRLQEIGITLSHQGVNNVLQAAGRRD